MPGTADAVVVAPNAVWVATVAGHGVFRLLRINPRTLKRTLLSQVT